MGERPTRIVKKKQLATEVTDALINSKQVRKSKNAEKKYSKLIVWDNKMKDLLEEEAKKRGISSTALIKYCVAKELINSDND